MRRRDAPLNNSQISIKIIINYYFNVIYKFDYVKGNNNILIINIYICIVYIIEMSGHDCVHFFLS